MRCIYSEGPEHLTILMDYFQLSNKPNLSHAISRTNDPTHPKIKEVVCDGWNLIDVFLLVYLNGWQASDLGCSRILYTHRLLTWNWRYGNLSEVGHLIVCLKKTAFRGQGNIT